MGFLSPVFNYFYSDALDSNIKRTLRDRLGAEATIDKIDIAIGTIAIGGLHIAQPAGYGSYGNLVDVERLDISYSLFDLFFRSRLDAMSLENVSVHVVKKDLGVKNNNVRKFVSNIPDRNILPRIGHVDVVRIENLMVEAKGPLMTVPYRFNELLIHHVDNERFRSKMQIITFLGENLPQVLKQLFLKK